ncbi:hypothetical protein K502DRAFT_325414 [Neoconidiobolus thromboides FSU 785]|nr:hypothetical protein K502DRAFT_325414 [Neoconidiobolus thromboides FSU 785]
MNTVGEDTNFNQKKSKILHDLSIPDETDLSPKGSVDIPILPIMDVLNSHKDYVTTSSCSGRIAIYCDPIVTADSSEEADLSGTTPKGGGYWLMVTHDKIDMEQIKQDSQSIELLLPNVKLVDNPNKEYEISRCLKSRFVWFKFEPMVLHVQARDTSSGKELLETSLALGFRNSGLILSNKGRCLVGIRSAAKLDVPIARVTEENEDGTLKAELLVTPAYLTMLLRIGNHRFDLNFDHMKRYKLALEKNLFNTKSKNKKEYESKEERRNRKRLEGLEIQKNKLAEKEEIVKKSLEEE